MQDALKYQFKAELSAISAMLTPVSGMTAGLNQSAYPVSGQMVLLPALPMTANAINIQKEAIAKLITLLERVLEAA